MYLIVEISINANNMTIKLNSIGLEKDPKDTTVVVAMSGGVDSSTVAGIMKRDGYKVIGITLKLYDDTKAVSKSKQCCAGQDIFDALFVYLDRIDEAQSNNGRWFNVSYSWGGGDSLDRERVRDIILESPQFVWSH